MVKNMSATWETQVLYLGQEDLDKGMATPLFLPGESHGQRNLVGYCPCYHKELDMTKQLSMNLTNNWPYDSNTVVVR